VSGMPRLKTSLWLYRDDGDGDRLWVDVRVDGAPGGRSTSLRGLAAVLQEQADESIPDLLRETANELEAECAKTD